jgi:hypothetical protein
MLADLVEVLQAQMMLPYHLGIGDLLMRRVLGLVRCHDSFALLLETFPKDPSFPDR